MYSFLSLFFSLFFPFSKAVSKHSQSSIPFSKAVSKHSQSSIKYSSAHMCINCSCKVLRGLSTVHCRPFSHFKNTQSQSQRSRKKKKSLNCHSFSRTHTHTHTQKWVLILWLGADTKLFRPAKKRGTVTVCVLHSLDFPASTHWNMFIVFLRHKSKLTRESMMFLYFFQQDKRRQTVILTSLIPFPNLPAFCVLCHCISI